MPSAIYCNSTLVRQQLLVLIRVSIRHSTISACLHLQRARKTTGIVVRLCLT